jgi:ribonuclease PH
LLRCVLCYKGLRDFFLHTIQMLIRQFARHEHVIRDVSFVTDVTRSSDGSCVIKVGNTHILCTACLDMNIRGLHVEFGILPGATDSRTPRERGSADFHTQDIQNFVHQSLVTALDEDALKNFGVYLDCDVLQSEGSLKASCVSGGFVALALALKKWTGSALFPKFPLIAQVAGISCGLVKGQLLLDLDQQEAPQADLIGDFVFTADEQIVAMDIATKRYGVPFSQINDITTMAVRGVRKILEAQKRCLNMQL